MRSLKRPVHRELEDSDSDAENNPWMNMNRDIWGSALATKSSLAPGPLKRAGWADPSRLRGVHRFQIHGCGA
jgi:hypothetical protein